jgi:hypothetical protein
MLLQKTACFRAYSQKGAIRDWRDKRAITVVTIEAVETRAQAKEEVFMTVIIKVREDCHVAAA